MGYHVFIDESGQQGIGKVREKQSGGASPYFVMGAVVCRTEDLEAARDAIRSFRVEIKKKSWKHAADLIHNEKKYLASKLGGIPVRYFAVISKKSTLKGYKDKIESDPAKYYNKCSQYILEIVCKYLICAGGNEENIEIVFEQCRHDYDQMKRFLGKIKSNPHHAESKSLKILAIDRISARPKGSDEMLDIADFIAHAVFSCVNITPNNYGIPEFAYLELIESRFAGDKSGKVLGTGLRCIHDIKAVGLTKRFETILTAMRCAPPEATKAK